MIHLPLSTHCQPLKLATVLPNFLHTRLAPLQQCTKGSFFLAYIHPMATRQWPEMHQPRCLHVATEIMSDASPLLSQALLTSTGLRV